MNRIKGILIGTSSIHTTLDKINGTKFQSLFQGQRYGKSFRYHLVDLPNGAYTVELGFAELYFTEPGKRIFDIILQGQPVLENLDVFAIAGKNKALVKQFNAQVTGHTLDIEVTARIDNAFINHLRLIKGTQKYDLDCAGLLKIVEPNKAEFDPKTGIIRNTANHLLWKTGVPFGGIGTGKFELFTNGGIGNITFNHNWDRPIPYLRGSFFGIYTDDGDEITAKLLRVKQPYDIVKEYTNVETVDEIEYLGLFPRAELKFIDKTMPVKVALQTYSALIPQDNQNSCLPAAVFSFKLTNSMKMNMNASLVFSFENCLGCGGSRDEAEQWDDTTTNSQEPIEYKNLTGLLFNTKQEYKTNRQNVVGQYLLATEKKPGVKISFCPNWNAADDTVPFWPENKDDAQLQIFDVSYQIAEKQSRPAGAISAKISLKAKETKTIDFVLCWYMPHHITKKDNKDNGHAYLNQFPDIKSLTEYVYTHRQELLDKTKEWQDLVLESNLPYWLKLKLINSVFPMVTNTIYTQDKRFAVQESPIDMGGALGTMDQRMASHAFMTMFYPELDKSELELFAKCQQVDGRITHFDGNIHEIIGDPNVGYGITDWPDLSCSFIMQVLKEYRWTGDKDFFNRLAPHIHQALAWLESADKDGDSIPEGGSTYDYEKPFPGAFIYSASCYLGALKAGIEVARIQKDTKLQKKYENRFELVQKKVIELLWNGKYFIKQYNPKTGEKNPNSFIAQFAGDWLSQLSGLGNTLPKKYIQTGIKNIIKMHLDKFKPVPPMEVTPNGKCAIRHCFIIQHEPYLGCEAIYEGFVDAGLDVIKRVYDVVWEQNKSPWNQSLNYAAPDGQQGFLVTYMTCPTTWHVLNALSGATLDVPNQTLYLSPRLEANPKHTIRNPQSAIRNLKIPIFFSKFWAQLEYEPKEDIAKLKVIKTFGKPINIKQILIQFPNGKEKMVKLKSAVLMQPEKSITVKLNS
jgi:non-lysosomal glucosylceramidase